MIKYIILLFVPMFLLSCYCKKNMQNKGSDSTIEKIGMQSYGKDFKVNYNSTKEFALIYIAKEVRQNDPFPTILYSIVDIKDDKVVYKDAVAGGKIRWIGDFDIEVSSLVNRPKDILHSTSNMLYKLNVKSLKK